MLIFEILIFGFALWLGAYLISRNPSDLRLILAGAGLITYAIGLALGILASQAENQDLALVCILRRLDLWRTDRSRDGSQHGNNLFDARFTS